MGETGRPGRNPRQGITAKAVKGKPVGKAGRPEPERRKREGRGGHKARRAR